MATLDGNGSLHGMGIIAVSTPKDNVPLIAKLRVINRQQRIKVNKLVREKGVPILQYVVPNEKGLSSVELQVYTRSLHTKTDIAAAPENLRKFVRCKCKLSSRNPCGTNICSCRKNGLKCVIAYGDYREENCKNAEDIIASEEEIIGLEGEDAFRDLVTFWVV